MSKTKTKTKKQNNQPSKPKYQELNDFELEVVCGGQIHIDTNEPKI